MAPRAPPVAVHVLVGGLEAVGDAERDPRKPATLKGLEAALTKVLEMDPDAAKRSQPC